jgi:hypothetical protein
MDNKAAVLLLVVLHVLTVVRGQISFGGSTNVSPPPREKPKSCTSPDGLEGECVYLLECKPILQLLRRKPLPQPILNHLRQSVCGRTRDLPDVCCPRFRAIAPPTPITITPTTSNTTQERYVQTPAVYNLYIAKYVYVIYSQYNVNGHDRDLSGDDLDA